MEKITFDFFILKPLSKLLQHSDALHLGSHIFQKKYFFSGALLLKNAFKF